MTVKLFELRDRGTCMPVMATHLRNRDPREFWLLRRAGYGSDQIGGPEERYEPYIILTTLDGVRSQYDPFAWNNTRTLRTAHLYIIERWNTLNSGDVIDVECILGESRQPKESEQVTG